MKGRGEVWFKFAGQFVVKEPSGGADRILGVGPPFEANVVMATFLLMDGMPHIVVGATCHNGTSRRRSVTLWALRFESAMDGAP